MKHNKLLIVIVLLIVILVSSWFIFTPSPTKTTVDNPTKATVDNFLKENSCNPSSLETDYASEYECAAYLRRHTTLLDRQIISVPKSTFLFVHTPFNYFNYVEPNTSDSHVYIFVVTSDEGALVYNPINGNLIGSYDDLVSEVGCKIQPNEDLYLAYEKCRLIEQQKQLDILKLNSTAK